MLVPGVKVGAQGATEQHRVLQSVQDVADYMTCMYICDTWL